MSAGFAAEQAYYHYNPSVFIQNTLSLLNRVTNQTAVNHSTLQGGLGEDYPRALMIEAMPILEGIISYVFTLSPVLLNRCPKPLQL